MGGGRPFVLGQLCLGRCEANPSRTHGCACPWWLRLMTLGVSPGEPGEGSYIWVKNQQSPLKRLWIKVLLLRALVVCMSVCAFSITPGIYLKGKPYQTCGTLRPWNINILQWLPSRGDWYSAAPPLVYSQAVFNVADMCIKKRLEKGKHFQAPLQCGFSFCLCPFFFFFLHLSSSNQLHFRGRRGRAVRMQLTPSVLLPHSQGADQVFTPSLQTAAEKIHTSAEHRHIWRLYSKTFTDAGIHFLTNGHNFL